MLPVAGFGEGSSWKGSAQFHGSDPLEPPLWSSPMCQEGSADWTKYSGMWMCPVMTKEPWLRHLRAINNKWPKSCQLCEFCLKHFRCLVCSSETAATLTCRELYCRGYFLIFGFSIQLIKKRLAVPQTVSTTLLLSNCTNHKTKQGRVPNYY